MIHPFTYCLNTSTIRCTNTLALPDEIDLAAEAGYGAIEPWIKEIETYRAGGGAMKDLRKRLDDRGIAVASAIGFAPWIVNHDDDRARGLEQAKREMGWVAELGGKYIAAPPVGFQDRSDLDLARAAERYAALFDAGKAVGVTPLVEVWGFSQCLSTLGEALYIAAECRRPGAAILADVYHLYKGGSGHSGLRLINGAALPVFHVNDYPAGLSRDAITDADRVYPGDGIAPLREIFTTLRDIGCRAYLSLELFNKRYYQQDPATVARTGLARMKAAVEAAL
jgi:2-keto-myo-inositol isomerase